MSFRVVMADGHYIGCVYCSCTDLQFARADFDPSCLMHSASDEEQIQALADQARGIDITEVLAEQAS